MREQLDKSLWARRASSSLFAAAALIALLLAALGVYGTASYRVSWRTHEFGLRIALGAGRREVLSLVLGEGFKLALTGVAFGTAGALGLTRFLSSLLFAIQAYGLADIRRSHRSFGCRYIGRLLYPRTQGDEG